MLWNWIDAHAAWAGLCLVLLGGMGLALYLRSSSAPAFAPMPRPARHILALLGLLAGLGLALMAQDMLCLSQAGGCAARVDWLRFDAWVLQQLGPYGQEGWLAPVVWLTQLGHVVWMSVLSAIVLLVLGWRRDWLRAGAWVLGSAGVGLWIRAIKHAVGRPRPADGLVSEGGFSFPSGHSAGTLVLYCMLAWLLLPHLPRAWRRPLLLLGLVVALGVGASRVLLRVHFASDVLAGWLLGLAWMALVMGAAEWANARGRQPGVPA
ncbi:phosphatase PAP2 family protein [Comamonas composti]|uniref:phosphatase PAP2 family protein n=1 Tax=Comamonas composti TaxID=408558 RepID=UPI00041CC5E6|nr:phosphatase PAP2 family protein [Comamonas composti]